MYVGERLAVAATGVYLPERIVRTEELEGRVVFKYDAQGKKTESRKLTSQGIFEVSGIRERRYAGPHESARSMALAAARSALDSSGVSADSLTGILCASVSERRNFPGIAPFVASNLGIKPVFAYDINAACAGAIVGIIQAQALALFDRGNYLVIGSEHMTSMVDESDINFHLFGDGAGAVLLSPVSTAQKRGLIAHHASCDPLEGKLDLIYKDSNGFTRLPDGSRVLKEAIHSMVDSIKMVKRRAHNWDHVDVYIPHQANCRIIDGVERKLQDPGSIVYKTIDRFANMSSATCIVALDEALKKRVVKEGSKVILTSFGSGLTTATVGIQF